MKKFFVGLLGLSLLISFTLVAGAQPREKRQGPPPMGPKGAKAMDTDKDGKVSLKEWQDFHENHFKKIDKNGDGFLTEDEMRPPRGPKTEE